MSRAISPMLRRPRPWSLRAAALAALGACACMGAPSSARAQGWVSLEEDDDANRWLDEAVQHETSGRWREALALYRRVLEKKPDHLRKVGAGDDALYTSVAEYITRHIARDYPPEGLAAYRAEYEALAQGLYEAYLKERRPACLETIVHQYFFTSLGDPAAYLLAGRLFDAGRYAEAIYYWERILRYHPPALARTVPPELVAARLLSAYRLLRVSPPQNELEKPLAAGAVRVGASPVESSRLMEMIERFPLAAEWISGPAVREEEPSFASDGPPPQRPLHWVGLSPDRPRALFGDLRSDDPYPLPRAWEPFALFDAAREDDGGVGDPRVRAVRLQRQWRARRALEAAGGRPQAPDYPFFAEAAREDGQDVVVIQNGYRIFGIDPTNGRLLWVGSGSLPAASSAAVKGAVFGCARSGRRIYANMMSSVAGAQGDGVVGPRTLRCYDAVTGKRIWDAAAAGAPDAGGRDARARDAARVGPMLFPSPPAVGGGRVYAAALVPQRDRDIYVYAFKDGERDATLLWKRFICSVTAPAQWNALEWPAATTPCVVESGGVVYCVTNVGVVAALHGATGHVLWLAKYKSDLSDLEAAQRARGPWGLSGPIHPFSPPVVSGNRLFVFPQDAAKLVLYHAGTGAVTDSVDAGEYYFFLGVHRTGRDGLRTAVLAGKRVLFLAPDAGQDDEREKTSPPLIAPVVGQGAVARGTLYFPTRFGVVRFDLATHKILDDPPKRWVEESDAGNLLVTGSTLISVGAERAAAYVDLGVYRAREGAGARQAPPYPQSLIEFGAALMRNRRYEDAAPMLQRAVTLLGAGLPPASPDLASARLQLYRCAREQAVELLARGDEANLPRLRDLLVLARAAAPGEDQRAEVLFLTARALLTLGKGDLPRNLPAAVDAYQEVIEQVPNAMVAEAGAVTDRREKDDGGSRWVRAGRLAAEAIAQLTAAHGGAAYRAVEERAGHALDAARSTARPADLASVLERFPNSGAAWEAVRGRAEALRAGGGVEAALSAYEDYLACVGPGPRLRAQALLAIGDLASRARRPALASWALQRARRTAPDETIPEGGAAPPGRSVSAIVAERLAKLDTAPPPPAAPPPDALNLSDKKSPAREDRIPAHAGRTPRVCGSGEAPLPGAPVLPANRILLARGSLVYLWDLDAKLSVWRCPYPKGWLGFVLDEESAGSSTTLTLLAGAKGDAARKAGLATGDVLTALEGAAASPADFRRALAAASPGRPMRLEVRRDDRTLKITLVPDPWPEDEEPFVNAEDVTWLPNDLLLVPWRTGVAAVAPGASHVDIRWFFPAAGRAGETGDAEDAGARTGGPAGPGAEVAAVRGVIASRRRVYVHYVPADADGSREARLEAARTQLAQLQPQLAQMGDIQALTGNLLAASRVVCLEAATGQAVWERSYAGVIDVKPFSAQVTLPDEDVLVWVSTSVAPANLGIGGGGEQQGRAAAGTSRVDVLDGRTGLSIEPGEGRRLETTPQWAVDRQEGMLYYFHGGNDVYGFDLAGRRYLPRTLRSTQGLDRRRGVTVAAGFGRLALGHREGLVEVWNEPTADPSSRTFRLQDILRGNSPRGIDPLTPNALVFEGPNLLYVYSVDPTNQKGFLTAVDLAPQAPRVLWETVATPNEPNDPNAGSPMGSAILPATSRYILKHNRTGGQVFCFDKARDGSQEALRAAALPRGRVAPRLFGQGERLIIESEQEVRVYRR